MTDTPKTLLDAVRYYSDAKTCFETMLAVKWPDGKITCPKCGGDAIGVIRSRSMLQCKAKECRKQFSVKVNTIFEEGPLGLDKWFVAVWCIANAKNGISSLELGRALGVTQKTAWFLTHRIKLAMEISKCKRLPTSKLRTGRRTASVAMALSGQDGAKGRVLKSAKRGG